MKKFLQIVAFVVLILITSGCTSTHKIFLTRFEIKNERNRLIDMYECRNPTDTQYVVFRMRGDFGIAAGMMYDLKEELPDGRYQLYVHDKLYMTGDYKHKKKRW